jgi:hypothetical protein
MFIGFGVVFMALAQQYQIGSAAKMGPGYFPTILGALLLLIGIASLLRSFVARGEPLGPIAWKGAALVTGATVLFGFLLRPAGLVPALAVLIFSSAAASSRFKLDWRALALMLALIAFCALVFVKGLGLPLPLVGPWFGR